MTSSVMATVPSVRFSTAGSQYNKSYRLTDRRGFKLKFHVKAECEAVVKLSEGDSSCPEPHCYEVVLGINNRYSGIKRSPENSYKVVNETLDILNGSIFRGFWLSFLDGALEIGHTGSQEPFLSWQDPRPLNVSHFSLMTTLGNEGIWKFSCKEDNKGFYVGHGDCTYEDFFALSTTPIDSVSYEFYIESSSIAGVRFQEVPDADKFHGYQFVFGPEEESQLYKNDDVVAYSEVSPVLTKGSQPFWIEMRGSNIQAFILESEPFLDFIDPKPIDISCVTFMACDPPVTYKCDLLVDIESRGNLDSNIFSSFPIRRDENGTISVRFMVRSGLNAIVSLNQTSDDVSYRLVLGEISMLYKKTVVVATIDTPRLLSKEKYTKFHITLDGQVVQVSTCDMNGFLEFNDPEVLEVSSVVFGCDTRAQFKYYDSSKKVGTMRMLRTNSDSPSKQYKLMPVTGVSAGFQINCRSDAAIVLSERPNPGETDPGYEILIGSESNTSSSIRRRGKSNTSTITVNTPDILSEFEFKHFTITFLDGVLTVTKEGSAKPIVSLLDPDPLPVKYCSCSTIHANNANWEILETPHVSMHKGLPCISSKPSPHLEDIHNQDTPESGSLNGSESESEILSLSSLYLQEE